MATGREGAGTLETAVVAQQEFATPDLCRPLPQLQPVESDAKHARGASSARVRSSVRHAAMRAW